MRQAPPTKEHRLPLIGLWRREDAAVPQVVTQHDGEARLVERLHDDRADRLVVGEEVEDGEEEEEAEGQSGERGGGGGGAVTVSERQVFKHAKPSEVGDLTAGCR